MSSSTDSESQAVVDAANVSKQSDSELRAFAVPEAPRQNRSWFLLQWQNIVMTVCFTSALEIDVLFAQTHESQLSVSFLVLPFAFLLIFLSLFVANFIGDNFTTAIQVLETVAVMLVATTFGFTIAIPFPLSFKCVAWALYAVSLFTILRQRQEDYFVRDRLGVPTLMAPELSLKMHCA